MYKSWLLNRICTCYIKHFTLLQSRNSWVIFFNFHYFHCCHFLSSVGVSEILDNSLPPRQTSRAIHPPAEHRVLHLSGTSGAPVGLCCHLFSSLAKTFRSSTFHIMSHASYSLGYVVGLRLLKDFWFEFPGPGSPKKKVYISFSMWQCDLTQRRNYDSRWKLKTWLILWQRGKSRSVWTQQWMTVNGYYCYFDNKS